MYKGWNIVKSPVPDADRGLKANYRLKYLNLWVFRCLKRSKEGNHGIAGWQTEAAKSLFHLFIHSTNLSHKVNHQNQDSDSFPIACWSWVLSGSGDTWTSALLSAWEKPCTKIINSMLEEIATFHYPRETSTEVKWPEPWAQPCCSLPTWKLRTSSSSVLLP